MDKIISFFKEWADVIVASIMILLMLVALGCCIYTAIVNAWIGVAGIIGVVVILLLLIDGLISEIKSHRRK